MAASAMQSDPHRNMQSQWPLNNERTILAALQTWFQVDLITNYWTYNLWQTSLGHFDILLNCKTIGFHPRLYRNGIACM